MPFTQFSNLDFDQIKTQIKNYLRANSTFTDFDFEGSNFSVLIDTLAYNTYISSFNANMVVNESFLDSATLRENVVSLARNIGYVPRSRTAATAGITFEVTSATPTPTMTLKAGLVCVGNFDETSFVFSIPEDITTTTTSSGSGSKAVFGTTDAPIKIFEGSFLTKRFTFDGSLDEKFILNNSFIDTSTIVVFVGDREYKKVDNILRVDKDSEIFLIQEVQDEKYEILFGDGIIGKKLENDVNITVSYITTNGKSGNGPAFFSFAGNIVNSTGVSVTPVNTPNIVTITSASNGGEIETIDSIKYFAPRLYSSQYRAVTSRDYEAIVPLIYPNTESISVIGGEDLDPPQFGTVFISIKPRNGEFISDFDKVQILNNLKNYSLTGINQKIVDLQILFVEIDSFVYYNSAQVTNVDDLKTRITSALTTYSQSREVNKFGGRFKYSKVLNVIDTVDKAITSNITRVTIRRNLQVLPNQFAQYELCFGNQFNVKPGGFNIKSSKFSIAGETGECFLTDTPNPDLKTGIISIAKTDPRNNEDTVVAQSAGTVDYIKGDINLTTVNITSTARPNNVIEVQAFPESNDVIGLKDIYLDFSISNSTINMIKDTITSGEKISGVGFKVTSSYNNGEKFRG
tara:strand:+ start:440 stop:2329 length:1890 start_codon:yes stop_codon:yes gene_type:complete